MKSTKRVVPCVDKPKQYPYLGTLAGSGAVVFFTSPKCGVVVYKSSVLDSKNQLGVYASNWAESDFEEYKGQIILEND